MISVNRAVAHAAFAAALLIGAAGDSHITAQTSREIPRTSDGRPNLDGIWKVRGRAAADLRTVTDGDIPYQPWAATKKAENFANRATADPLNKCFMGGL